MGETIGEIKRKRGIGGPPMLHGSDLPASVSRVTVLIRELREAPSNFNSPAIVDLEEEVYGKMALAVNITNLRALATIVGFDEPEEADFDDLRQAVLKQRRFTLMVAMVNNPKLNKMTRSLFFELPAPEIKAKPAKKKR